MMPIGRLIKKIQCQLAYCTNQPPASGPTCGQPGDRYPDLRVDGPREDITQESEGGNRVVLDLGGGRFAGYGHLQAGSVAVKRGDWVKRGQRIAKAGSSGTGGGPHSHFQVMDRPSMLPADGVPYVFDAFVLSGQTPPKSFVNYPRFDQTCELHHQIFIDQYPNNALASRAVAMSRSLCPARSAASSSEANTTIVTLAFESWRAKVR